MDRRWAGALSGLIAASIWGGMYVVSDAVLDVVPPATLVLMRYVIALPVLWIAAQLSHTRGIQRVDWPKLALTAFVGFGVSLLAQFAGTKSVHRGRGRADYQRHAGLHRIVRVVDSARARVGTTVDRTGPCHDRRADCLAVG